MLRATLLLGGLAAAAVWAYAGPTAAQALAWGTGSQVLALGCYAAVLGWLTRDGLARGGAAADRVGTASAALWLVRHGGAELSRIACVLCSVLPGFLWWPGQALWCFAGLALAQLPYLLVLWQRPG